MRNRYPSTTFCLLLLLLLPPAALAQPATLADYWPHEDGRTWFYDQRHEELTLGEVTDSQARLYFAGTTIAGDGGAAQVLTGSVSSPPALTLSVSAIPAEVTNPLMRMLWRARPDLRPGILRKAALEPCPTDAIADWAPLLLSAGLAYRQTSGEVASWRCDLPIRAWLWLTSDLTPGSEATLKLVPDLADDVILHVTVLGLEDVTVPGGTFQDCLHVDYFIDYGTSECTSPEGDPLGTAHFVTRGFVRYAPEVGPIECFEEFVVVEATGACPGFGLGVVARSTLKLNAPSVPATTASWGRLKSAYRQ